MIKKKVLFLAVWLKWQSATHVQSPEFELQYHQKKKKKEKTQKLDLSSKYKMERHTLIIISGPNLIFNNPQW
jgi:hypothetical protein